MKSDLDINQAAHLKSIDEIVKSLHVKADDLDFYGAYQAKLKASFTNQLKENKASIAVLKKNNFICYAAKKKKKIPYYRYKLTL